MTTFSVVNVISTERTLTFGMPYKKTKLLNIKKYKNGQIKEQSNQAKDTCNWADTPQFMPTWK